METSALCEAALERSTTLSLIPGCVLMNFDVGLSGTLRMLLFVCSFAVLKHANWQREVK